MPAMLTSFFHVGQSIAWCISILEQRTEGLLTRRIVDLRIIAQLPFQVSTQRYASLMSGRCYRSPSPLLWRAAGELSCPSFTDMLLGRASKPSSDDEEERGARYKTSTVNVTRHVLNY